MTVNADLMRAAIVVTDPFDWTAQALFASLSKKGMDTSFLNFSDLSAAINGSQSSRFKCAGIDLLSLDALIVRDMGRSGATDVSLRLEVLDALTELKVPVINPPKAIARAANKFATSLALENAGVRTPKTVVTTSFNEAKTALHDFGRAVSKPLFGFKGKDIVLLESDVESDLYRLERIVKTEGVVYLQEFISLKTPRDIRAFVVNGQVQGAIYRNAPSSQWISNLARGGRPTVCPLSAEIKDLAGRAAKAVGAIYCGVDLMETAQGLSVIEVNGTPSGKGIFEALGVDVTEAISEHVHQNCYLRGR